MIEPGWIMDSECCCECGALLNYWESDLCFDCLEDQAYSEDQERYAVWDGDDWEEPTIGTPEEAYAADLSLSAAEIERLSED